MRVIPEGIPGMSLVSLSGAEVFSLEGTVKDDQGTPIAGALVALASNPSVRRSTDAKGVFRIDKTASINGKASSGVTGRNKAEIGIRGNCFQILLPAPAPAGSITLFGIHGKKRIEIPLGPLGPGAHLLDLPKLAAGVYSMWIAVGPYSGSAHIIHAGNRTTLMQKTPGNRHATEDAREASTLRRMAAAAADTLVVKKAGFVTTRIPVMSHDQAGIGIVMTPDPQRSHRT